jgi:hypothetical protein
MNTPQSTERELRSAEEKRNHLVLLPLADAGVSYKVWLDEHGNLHSEPISDHEFYNHSGVCDRHSSAHWKADELLCEVEMGGGNTATRLCVFLL